MFLVFKDKTDLFHYDWWAVVQSTLTAEYGSSHLLAPLQRFFGDVWTTVVCMSQVWFGQVDHGAFHSLTQPLSSHNGSDMYQSELSHICPVNFIVKATAIVTYTLEFNSTQKLFGHCQQLKQPVGILPSYIVWLSSISHFKPGSCTVAHEFYWPCTYFNWQRRKH